jgi:hypothetical protein
MMMPPESFAGQSISSDCRAPIVEMSQIKRESVATLSRREVTSRQKTRTPQRYPVRCEQCEDGLEPPNELAAENKSRLEADFYMQPESFCKIS